VTGVTAKCRSSTTVRGLLFYRLRELAVATTPKPARIIIGGWL
jgi:hypothetical protein